MQMPRTTTRSLTTAARTVTNSSSDFSSTEASKIPRSSRDCVNNKKSSLANEMATVMDDPADRMEYSHHDNQESMDPNTNNNSSVIVEEPLEDGVSLPTEIELVLLCLDYLRDVRRAYPPGVLKVSQGLDADYITVACWALTRAIQAPAHLTHTAGNDCFWDTHAAAPAKSSKSNNNHHNASTKNASNNNNNIKNLVAIPRRGKKSPILVPDLASMEEEFLLSEMIPSDAATTTTTGSGVGVGTPVAGVWYEYDDAAASNTHRFYTLAGLASGPNLRGPLSLGEIAAAGLAGLGARSRLDAERDMIQSPLFAQFIQAVQAKGFFDHDPLAEESGVAAGEAEWGGAEAGDTNHEQRERRRQAVYEERYRKVVAKFRTKLATKADVTGTGHVATAGDLLASAAAEQQRLRRAACLQEYEQCIFEDDDDDDDANEEDNPHNISMNSTNLSQQQPQLADAFTDETKTDNDQTPSKKQEVSKPTAPSPSRPDASKPAYLHRSYLAHKLLFGGTDDPNNKSTNQDAAPPNSNVDPTNVAPPHHNPADLEEAEKCKNAGNAAMQSKQYEAAMEAYTRALKLSPSGPNSHVYYSNRAAALVSLKRFSEAIADSERSLNIKPDYGKAHARLGLAHFLLGNYRAALEAYTVALKYEPDNKSSRNYLEKAAKRLAAGNGAAEGSNNSNTDNPIQTSYSVVSEWERSAQLKQQQGGASRHVSTSSPNSSHRKHHPGNSSATSNQDDREAERYKTRGNSAMASRDYAQALDAYSKAIQICPAGAQSHVYYSNRAAALCYLERYQEAEQDSLQALQLNPTYSKAHARLGLSRFFLEDYTGAVEAYTAALEQDPDNTASRSYLAKAKAKLDQQQHQTTALTTPVVLTSVLSQEQRKLMDDPNLRRAAQKAMTSGDATALLNDPEMKLLAKKATSDPALMAALHRK